MSANGRFRLSMPRDEASTLTEPERIVLERWGNTLPVDAYMPTGWTSTLRPGTPYVGQTIYESDTTRTMQWSGTAWRCIARISGTDTFSTTRIDQGASTSIAHTVSYSQYREVAGTVDWWFKLDLTAAGTGGNAVFVYLPVAAVAAGSYHVGDGMVFDASAPTIDTGTWEMLSTTQIGLHVGEGTNNLWGATPSIALASGESIRGHVRYPVR